MRGNTLVQTERAQQEPLHLTARPQLQQQAIPLDSGKATGSGCLPYRSFNKDAISDQLLLARRSVAGLSDEKLLAAEQYKLLCTRILEVARNQNSKVFLVTSALAEEGKTLTSMNIAYGLSHVMGKRVLLVELDLRRPSMRGLLGISHHSSEAGFLESSENWHTRLWQLHQNLDALIALSPSAKPDELVQGKQLRGFLMEARAEYDLIIIDSTPLLVVADTHALLPIVDHALMVVRANHTPIDCARDALAILGNKALGCVLNDLKKVKYEEYYGRYYIGGSSDD
jgi:capsular exopolysaccharide synthesis family protein